jgi:AcrR family transcriptional regulator
MDQPDQVDAAPEPRRRYSTPKRDARAAATRARIRAAAERLFLRDGYARTTMKAIAHEAGVSEKTMYLAFATKATLLRHVIQVAVQGDEAGIPLAQRPEWRALLAGPVEEVFSRFAELNTALMTRTAGIIALGEAAASTDPELAGHRDRAHAETRANLTALAAELQRRGALRRGVSEDHAADVIYAIATDEGIFLRLTGECGWRPARYADLIAHTLTAALAPT